MREDEPVSKEALCASMLGMRCAVVLRLAGVNDGVE